jgi:DTW domain-containing protein YfiP
MSETEVVAIPEPEPCARCGKAPLLCVCAGIQPIANRIGLLILQHPQEQDVELGTARLTALHFKNVVRKVGLSWPNLAKARGRATDPKRWAVLYLGSTKPKSQGEGGEIVAVDKKGEPLDGQRAILADLEGIIVLDGSWSQAKALWWRNAWMLKCRRLVLAPTRPSRYGKLRKEPRREGLSTLEAVGLVIGRLERKPEIEATLLESFDRLLAAYRSQTAKPKLP